MLVEWDAKRNEVMSYAADGRDGLTDRSRASALILMMPAALEKEVRVKPKSLREDCLELRTFCDEVIEANTTGEKSATLLANITDDEPGGDEGAETVTVQTLNEDTGK